MGQSRANKERFKGGEKIITTTCNSHCGGVCILKVYVKNGLITRIESDDGPEPQLRACLRGRAYRQRVYAPDRLLYPLKRAGERGQGKFERISWDEALDYVAKELVRVRNQFGPEAIFVKTSAGDIVSLNSALPLTKVISLLGGYTCEWGLFSFEQGMYAELATLGTLDGSGRDDLLNSRLIILWATDPATTIAHTNTTWYLAQAREKGTRIICIDPRFTDTAAVFAHQWIPIIPGTDTAMMIAMAYVIFNENLQDQKFMDTYCVGFDKFKDYVFGGDDGIPKTPQWAEKITSVPSEIISKLAREYATTKPAALVTGIAAGRTAFGEQYHRAAITLAAMTGNIGKSGGSSGLRSWMSVSMLPSLRKGGYLVNIVNPVVARKPDNFRNYLPVRAKNFAGVGIMPKPYVPEALLKGKDGGYPADYKLLFIINHNYPNQALNINKAVAGLKKLEFIVTVEQFMTPAAKWADIVLPTSTYMERNDLTESERLRFFGCQNKVIEPVGDTKSQFEIAKALAKKLGFTEFDDLTEEKVLQEIIKGTCIPDYNNFKKNVIHWVEPPDKPYVAFKRQIEDPENNPFPTPSGKIEIYSEQLARMNDPNMPPIPKYIEPWEGRNDPLVVKYPLQLLTIHPRRRAHTQNETLPWLRETQVQGIQINIYDAISRNIANDDMVKVFNDRGATVLPAIVTKRIYKGVVAIPEGAWYDPDENGIDRGGNPNVLTKDEMSPGGGYVTNTCLVEVEKFSEK